MIELSEITIDKKDLFDSYLRKKQYPISEFTFTNLFMWRHAFNIKYAVVNDFLCIFSKYGQSPPFTLMPVGDGDLSSVINTLISYFEQQGHRLIIKSLTKDMIRELEKYFPGRFEFKRDRNIDDYVYLSSDLIHLKGRKFSSKRNHINRFLENHQYVYLPITPEITDECIRVAEEWCKKKNCEDDQSLQSEQRAIVEALTNFEALQLKGGAIKVNEKIIAFTFGEQFTDDMAVVHVEKADPDIQGSYAMINQQFCEHEWRNVKYINREEDMGIPGLRKAKRSYRPVKMMEKSIATLKA